ncbi:MAG: hypothetical protein QN178_04305 [Armatimonadota bacterium]|nr:hypothetical protein [Armatimonadota bacterium]
MEQAGVVLAIHLRSASGAPPRSTGEARAIVGHGLDGDYHGKRRSDTNRQLLLVDRRVLESLGFAHGALREQLTVDFQGLDALGSGTRLRVGGAELEVTGPCEPCEDIGRINNVPDPDALRQRLLGRRGVLAKVVAITDAGRIRIGDPVHVLTEGTEPASAPMP